MTGYEINKVLQEMKIYYSLHKLVLFELENSMLNKTHYSYKNIYIVCNIGGVPMILIRGGQNNEKFTNLIQFFNINYFFVHILIQLKNRKIKM